MDELRRHLQIRAAGGADFTADGARIAFLTNITGVPQAWSVPAGGGWPEQATFGTERVEALAASPADADVVVFARDQGGNERSQLHVVAPDGLGERPLVTDPGAIHRLGAFTPDGAGVVYCANGRNGVDFDVYRADLDGDAPRRVATLGGSNRVADVTPDGQAALVVHARSTMDTDLLVVDLRRGTVEHPTRHASPARHLPGGFTDEGRAIVLTSDRGGDTLMPYRLDVARGEWHRFAPGEAWAGWDVEGLVARDGDGVAAVNVDGRSRLHRFDPATGEVRAEIRVPPGVVADLALRPGGGQALCTLSGPSRPADVWAADLDTAVARPVTRSSTAGLDPSSFVAPDLVRVESFDGLQVPVWVYRPGGVSGPPAVVSVHGGPEAQERPSFDAFYQYLVARGVAVLAPNVRGSTGYGRRYAGLDDRRRRPDAVADLAAVAAWARRSGDVDAGRLAVMGASYGGFMTLATLTTAPELWAAGVSIVGIANLVTFLERTGDYRRALREAEYGSLADDRDFLQAMSPIHRAEAITAPLLVVHGANDPRVPVGEATQIVERLRGLGREVELLVFDDEGHGIVKLDNRVAAYGAVADFLERTLGP